MNSISENIRKFIKSNEILNLVTQFTLLFFELFLRAFIYFYEPLRNLGYVLVGVGGILGYLYYSGYWNSIADKIIPPNPIIASSSCDDKSTDIGNLEYSLRVVTNVRNTGGSGKIIVEAEVQQGHELWTKSETLYMEPHQTTESIIIFDEVSFLDSNPQCSVRAYAHSK